MTVDATEEQLTEALSSVLLHPSEDGFGVVEGLDDDLVAYIAGMLSSKVDEDPSAMLRPWRRCYIHF
jgi:hypothetical protein